MDTFVLGAFVSLLFVMLYLWLRGSISVRFRYPERDTGECPITVDKKHDFTPWYPHGSGFDSYESRRCRKCDFHEVRDEEDLEMYVVRTPKPEPEPEQSNTKQKEEAGNYNGQA